MDCVTEGETFLTQSSIRASPVSCSPKYLRTLPSCSLLIRPLIHNRQKKTFYTKINEFIKEVNKAQEKKKEEAFDKKKFMEELKKEREEYDKEYEERRAAYDFADKQQIRQMNMT